MRTADQWFDLYTETHQQPFNRLIHRICAPIAALGIVGLLWSLPIPGAFEKISPALNWGSTFIMASIVYYFLMSITLGLGMIAILLGMVIGIHWLDSLWVPLYLSSLGLLTASFAGMYAGHVVEGKPAQLLADVQLIMIAPAFLLASAYRRLGISY